jgi:hypothetical protein
MKTMESTEEVSSHRVEKRVKRHKSQRSATLCQRKTGGELKKRLADPWSGKRITKKAHVGRGQETKWEIPVKT